MLWYLAHRDELKNEARDTVIAESINGMTNRICAMLARQGRLVATMFELTYSSMSQTDEGKEAFQSALTAAKQKMAKSVEKDEKELVAAMKRTVKAQQQAG